MSPFKNGSIFLVWTVTIFSGCAGGDLPKLQFVDNLRILAIAASPVTVHPGNTTTISALIGDPKGNGRSITYTWEVCALANADASLTRCTSVLTTSSTTTTSTTPTFSYTNTSSGAEALLVTLSVSAGTEVRKGVKNLVVVPTSVSEQAAPSLTTLKINGDSATTTYNGSRGANYPLEIVATGLSGTSYFTTWISDGGSIEASRTTAGAFTNSMTLINVSGTYTVYAVLNDGSGGVAFISRALQIP